MSGVVHEGAQHVRCMRVGSSVSEELHNSCLLLFVVEFLYMTFPRANSYAFGLGPLPMSTDSSSSRREVHRVAV